MSYYKYAIFFLSKKFCSFFNQFSEDCRAVPWLVKWYAGWNFCCIIIQFYHSLTERVFNLFTTYVSLKFIAKYKIKRLWLILHRIKVCDFFELWMHYWKISESVESSDGGSYPGSKSANNAMTDLFIPWIVMDSCVEVVWPISSKPSPVSTQKWSNKSGFLVLKMLLPIKHCPWLLISDKISNVKSTFSVVMISDSDYVIYTFISPYILFFVYNVRLRTIHILRKQVSDIFWPTHYVSNHDSSKAESFRVLRYFFPHPWEISLLKKLEFKKIKTT